MRLNKRTITVVVAAAIAGGTLVNAAPASAATAQCVELQRQALHDLYMAQWMDVFYGRGNHWGWLVEEMSSSAAYEAGCY
jgi:hypothetical protein